MAIESSLPYEVGLDPGLDVDSADVFDDELSPTRFTDETLDEMARVMGAFEYANSTLSDDTLIPADWVYVGEDETSPDD